MNISITTTAKNRRRKRGRCWRRSSFRSRIEGVMAKLALINREEKRRKTVAKYAKKRADLKRFSDQRYKLSDEERMAARLKLQQLPRNASPCVSAIVAR
jgi:hypothetical protein